MTTPAKPVTPRSEIKDLWPVVPIGFTTYLSTFLIISAISSPDHETQPQARPLCPAPSPQALHDAQVVFNGWQDPLALARRREQRHETARRIRDLDKGSTNTSAGLVRYTQNASKILKPYGVTIDLFDPLVDGGQPYTKDIIPNLSIPASRVTKRAIQNIVRGVTGQPIKYVELSGLEQVTVYLQKNNNVQASAIYQVPFRTRTVGNKVYYNAQDSGDPDVMAHEIEHLIDGVECSPANFHNDPSFALLNPNDIYTGDIKLNKNQAKNRVPGNDDFEEKFYQLENQQYTAAYAHDKPRFERLRKLKEALLQRAVTVSTYSFTDVGEDKAELGAELSSPYEMLQTVSDPSLPTIHKKFMYLMARLYEKSPELVRQFSALAVRPDRDGYYTDVTTYDKLRRAIKAERKATQVTKEHYKTKGVTTPPPQPPSSPSFNQVGPSVQHTTSSRP